MRRAYFFGESCFGYIIARERENRNIERPTDDEPVPILPDEEPSPAETPADERRRDPRRRPDDQPDPPPVREPNPNEPTRFF